MRGGIVLRAVDRPLRAQEAVHADPRYYIIATVATAFAFAPWYFYLARFFTGAGIGGEYAAINSAIGELIPARVRGRVDLGINGSYWFGSAAGAALALLLLDTSIFPQDLGRRLAFGLGAVLGVLILVVRRHVPESPRWLFIHGREDEAERIVDGIEDDIREENEIPAARERLTQRLGRHPSLSDRYVEGWTQERIAQRIGVTQMQVSRLLSRILRDLGERAAS